jgi:hypothetical protein
MSKTIVYGAVIFEGSMEKVAKAKEDLSGRRLKLIGTSESTIGFSEISQKVLPDLKAHLAEKYGLSLLHCYTPKEHEVGVRRKIPKQATQLSLQPNKWYFLEAAEDHYPFLFVRGIEEAEGQHLFEVELLTGENAIPTRMHVFADDLAKLGMRPATTDDFVEYDIPSPEANLLTAQAVHIEDTPSPDLTSLSNFVN